jgi:hypothetical protein
MPCCSRKVRNVVLKVALSMVGPLGAHATIANATAGDRSVALQITLDKGALELKVAAPLDALVSFNRRAMTGTEQAELQKAMTTLKSPTLLFELPVAAGCSLTLSSLNTDTSERSISVAAPVGGDKAGPAELQQAGTGGMVHAEYSGTCSQPKALDQILSPWFQVFPLTKELTAKTTIGGKGHPGQILKPADKVSISLVSISTSPKPAKKDR